MEIYMYRDGFNNKGNYRIYGSDFKRTFMLRMRKLRKCPDYSWDVESITWHRSVDLVLKANRFTSTFVVFPLLTECIKLQYKNRWRYSFSSFCYRIKIYDDESLQINN